MAPQTYMSWGTMIYHEYSLLSANLQLSHGHGRQLEPTDKSGIGVLPALPRCSSRKPRRAGSLQPEKGSHTCAQTDSFVKHI